MEDRIRILRDGPWSIMNSLLVIQPVDEGVAISEIEFNTCPFWVQIHGLPVEKMNRANAITIGQRFQKLLAIESSPDGILLGRSFLRVRVVINLSQPLPKGFWLRKRTAQMKDLWISYKYEKLSDFCYSCGRIGHDNRGCKFRPHEDAHGSVYDAKIRASVAKRAPFSIEEFRKEVDAAEIRVNQLIERCRPEPETADIAARENNALMENVKPFTRGGRNTSRAPDVATESFGTGVVDPMTQDSPSRTDPSIPRGISNPYPFWDCNSKNSDESGRVVQSLSFNLPMDLFRTPGPSPHPYNSSPITSLTPSNTPYSPPKYFVTEPLESPNSPKSPSALKTFPLSEKSPLIEEISPNAPPTTTTLPDPTPFHPPSPGRALVSSFSNLAIKRKSCEDVENSSRSKIQRLCLPDPTPKPLTPGAKPTRNKRFFKRGGLRSTPGASPNLPLEPLDMDLGLCDVPVQKIVDRLEVDLGMVLNAVANYSENGRVAGPEQPHPQC